MGELNLALFPPESNWAPPKTFPNLKDVKILGVDVETKDPLLLEKGPGSFRKDGFLAGVSLATADKSWYFPLRHLTGGNLPLENTLAFLKDVFKVEREYIGANLQYEMEWLASENLQMRGRFIDIQVVQALIDEEQESNALDVLCKQYLNTPKDETLLKQAASAHGIHPKRDLWKLHSKFVGPYAEFDAASTLQIFKKQWEEIQKQNLEEIFTLESEVTPLLWLMRQQGVRVDLTETAALSKKLLRKEDAMRLEVLKTYDLDVDEWSGSQLSRKCQELKIVYPRTDKGNPSFTGSWLDESEHHFLQCISKIREINRLRQTFVEDWIFKHEIDGVIHPQWRQLVADDGGTRTGRLAASNPNPQQVPARSDLAPLIRALFVPMHADERWVKLDYSQQEPRLLVHFAHACGMESAGVIRLAYINDPSMDIYGFLASIANISRRESKGMTLGRMYGMGAFKLSIELGISVNEATKKLDEFDRSVSFVKEMANLCSAKAQSRGWIKTLCGRKRHYNWWEPADTYDRVRIDPNADVRPRKLKAAEEKWPKQRLRRAFTHKSLNSLIQGSAADMTKQAMIMTYRQTGKIPYLQLHDETDHGIREQSEVTALEEIAKTCVKLTVPIKVDTFIGDHWR